ncbi:MAG: hypothetical protein Q9163_001184 [Psora crenata]
MDATQPSSSVKTRFLIISDTHGMQFSSENRPQQRADVAIHCGDLTEETKLEEYRDSIELLKEIEAPLKLVIAGNHDWTMDTPIFKKKVAEVRPPLDPTLVKVTYGDYGEARQILKQARNAGIILLDEGKHTFTLRNGALITVYASPWTPQMGEWGFQYSSDEGHNFEIVKSVDIAITHGPPKGIMDYTIDRQRAGSSELFAAIARARPRLHCFGHIHEGWGAKMVTWRDQPTETPSHFTDIDNDRSTVIENLSGFTPSRFDTPEIKLEKEKKLNYYRQERCYFTSHCSGDIIPLGAGNQTLFVNASIEGSEEQPMQLPWLVDLELSPAN